MGYDVLKRKCGAHNRILGNRETCPQCASDLRAQMGPRPQKLTFIYDEASLFWSEPAEMYWVQRAWQAHNRAEPEARARAFTGGAGYKPCCGIRRTRFCTCADPAFK